MGILSLSLVSSLFRFDFLKSCGLSSRFSILAPWLTRTFTEHNEFDQPLKSHHEATQFCGILCMFFPFRALNFSRVVKWNCLIVDSAGFFLCVYYHLTSFSVCFLFAISFHSIYWLNTDSTRTDFLTHYFFLSTRCAPVSLGLRCAIFTHLRER